ncbi:glycine cleavage system protein GcvH [Homoserinimonas sp. OAct 916]|uniref:glycine cleavage system protein GcvH n=1 Tax=Homoserinimonas sp. OAct 916 TaxID=2211450 RepID=UPI000DBE2B0A|nr:glycine cleavage system protein GcvH [Homoserinimonas sp. OAct 916]
MAHEANLKYTSDHEWLDIDGNTATIGITAFAADQLGDVVFVELPSVDDAVEAGTVVGEIESTKSVGELFAPMNATITAVNDAVVDAPELVNSDPLGDGWLIKVSFDSLDGVELLSLDEYNALVTK